MRKTIALIATFLPLMTFTFAQQAAAPAAVQKIGFVNSYEVLYGTDEGKLALEKLNKLMEGKQQLFNSQKADLDKLKADFEQKQMNLNAATRQEMAATIAEKEKALTRFQEDAQGEITKNRDELLAQISEKASKIINDYAQKNSFGAVFLRDPQIVTFVAAPLDITPEVIKLYNQQHPASGAASTPATPKQ